jgi:single-strand DNA-binding protein
VSGFNQAVLLGRLAAEPEQLKTKSGKPFLRAVIVTNVFSKSAEGVSEERVSSIPVTIFGRTAEVFGQYVQKGDIVHLIGRLDSREYKTESGEKRLTLGLIVEQLHLLPNERRNAGAEGKEGSKS